MNRLFHEYAPHRGEIQGRRNGVLISNDQGEAVAYAMWKLEDRGPMMIEPGCKVYKGMIVGEHTRDNDLEINVLKGKQLTNIRTQSKDEAVRLTPPIQMTLEKALAYIEDDERVEVTPKSIRLRKSISTPTTARSLARARRAGGVRPLPSPPSGRRQPNEAGSDEGACAPHRFHDGSQSGDPRGSCCIRSFMFRGGVASKHGVPVVGREIDSPRRLGKGKVRACSRLRGQFSRFKDIFCPGGRRLRHGGGGRQGRSLVFSNEKTSSPAGC